MREATSRNSNKSNCLCVQHLDPVKVFSGGCVKRAYDVFGMGMLIDGLMLP